MGTEPKYSVATQTFTLNESNHLLLSELEKLREEVHRLGVENAALVEKVGTLKYICKCMVDRI